MSAARETPDFRDNLTHLQTESLKVIALFASVISLPNHSSDQHP